MYRPKKRGYNTRNKRRNKRGGKRKSKTIRKYGNSRGGIRL